MKCDNCYELFTINKIKSKKIGIYQGYDVRFNYFACTGCKMKYFVGVSEKEYNKLLADYRTIVKRLGVLVKVNANDRNIEEIEKLQDDGVKLQGEIKTRHEMLKSMFELK
ncbi:hypothetical protein [Psychrobacillus sp. L3]|uniref:hypothetical protein n=1 Tax=Psychrobacillus sp. L3 TaxID=3236891 RepID=UPI0036F38AD0